jgi:hypothetical protein
MLGVQYLLKRLQMFEINMLEEHQEAIHATSNGTFGVASTEFIKWLESLHSASDCLAVKINVITEEENKND